jgi:hypothetical protein
VPGAAGHYRALPGAGGLLTDNLGILDNLDNLGRE